MGRVFCIVHAMISLLLWNACSRPRGELRHGWCRMVVSVFLRLWPQGHPPAWTEMTTTCGTTLTIPWSLILAGSWITLQQVWMYRIVLVLPPKKQLHHIVLELILGAEVLLLCPPPPMGGGWAATLPQTLILGVTMFKFAKVALAVTHSICNSSFSPWLWSAMI